MFSGALRAVTAGLLGVGIAAGLLAACSSETDGDSAAAGKYEQTWSRPYQNTSCRQWNDQLTTHEQFVAAADMLLGAQRKDDPQAGLPPDALVHAFADAISTACVIPSMTLTDAAVGVYLSERETFQPD